MADGSWGNIPEFGNFKYEFGVMFDRYPGELHRGPMSEQEAVNWVREFEEDGGRPGAFFVAERKVGPWVKS